MVNHDWGPLKLGQLHPVITRSWDRAREPILQTFWPAKWSTFQEQIQPPVSSDMIEFVSDPHAEKSEVRNRLVASEGRTCVGVLFALSTANVSLLKGILMAGIPVALWSRVCPTERAHPDGVEQTIRALLKSDNLPELPRKTMLERLQPKAFVDPGNHLTLLWDDPGKILPIRDIQSGTQLYTP